MPHIAIEEGIPGILGPMKFRPETTKPLRELAEILLRGNGTLTPAERESIAAFVSSRNDCRFCQLSHSAAAAEHLGGEEEHYTLIESVKNDFASASISPKLKALLAIAGKVQQGGKHVTSSDMQPPAPTEQPISRFTTPSSSRRHSACSIGMSMVWRPGSQKTQQSIAPWASSWRTLDIHALIGRKIQQIRKFRRWQRRRISNANQP